MSTHPQRTTESNPTTDARTDATPAGTAGQATPASDDTDRQHGDTPESWVARCQAQFDATHRDRLRNLADDANHAMPDGV
ncbi:hypothetical protein [Halobacterium noricense]|uniref:hypothetical protein n=1 Tax=Halobacterium noricense TaxID=223182 RepID=UPI001E4FFC00|nr:hypothetical protein [Halobacterium noricense]UHH24738.1 hypothetical protein LT974_12210 [Halobacterium noricense]